VTKTQIVILAAGQGRRLLPLTKNLPKTMLKVQGVSIIDHILEAIDMNVINEILITVGHSKSVVMNYLKNEYKGIPVKYVDNPKHSETNSLYSLWLAKNFLKEKIAIINADTIFNKKILENLINSKYEAALAIDDTISIPLPDEAMKVTIENKKIIDVSKTILPEKTSGDAIGIYKFSGESLKILISELDNLVSKSITKQLFTYAVKNILKKTDIFSVSTEGRGWIEIDDENDLNAAQDLINKIKEI
jgi:choline kinase